jgi:2-polyprenyl-6-methoxyphenol hydroxylase-like FAD-dependent oxidoreductase
MVVQAYQKNKDLSMMTNDAMQVFHKLDLKAKIVNRGNPISAMNITSAGLAHLSSIDLKYFEEKHDSQNIAIHRARLQQILTNELKPNTLH